MNTKRCIPRLTLIALALASSVIGLAQPASAGTAGDDSIVASLNPPPPGLACADAAARTSVYFQFARPPFAVSQVSLYLDGKGVAKDAIDQHWPTVTLTHGLHVGRNTVDIVANGSGGQTLSRRLVVLVGASAGGDATPPATVACDDAVAQAGDPDEDEESGAPEVIEEPPPVIVQQQPQVIVEQPPVIYESAPVYVYRPYPLFALDAFVPLVPFFGFSFFYSNFHPYCPPPRVVYQPSPYYGWHGNGGGGDWHGGHDGWHDGDRGRHDGWHGGGQVDGRGGWTSGPAHGNDRRPHDPVGPRPAVIESQTTIDGGGEHRGGHGYPQGPDNWHGRSIPRQDVPRAPAPSGPVPNRGFEQGFQGQSRRSPAPQPYVARNEPGFAHGGERGPAPPRGGFNAPAPGGPPRGGGGHGDGGHEGGHGGGHHDGR